jgi:thioredoxin reductase (NADPH)
MFDYDVVIVGGGPAGLTAGLHLSRAGHKTLLLEKELYGGSLQHTDTVDDYPGFPEGITGAQLAAQMIDHATTSGLALDQADVTSVEVFSRSRYVACADGRGFSCGVVILAGGLRFRSLGLPQEETFRGRGVIDCTPCDSGFFVDRPVVIVGSTDFAVRDAIHLTSVGARVTLLADTPELQATPRWRSRLDATDGITVHFSARVDSIVGSDRLESIEYSTGASQDRLSAAGLAVRIGTEPATAWLEDVVDLTTDQRIVVNACLETSARYVLAAGDIRGGARPTVASAVGDGANAAARAEELLAELNNGGGSPST